MKCPNCGEEIQEGMSFCGNCGTKAPSVKTCIKCGKEIPIAMMFCGYCGTPQNGSSVKAGNGFSMGDKNVIAGDVIGKKEEVNITGNATIIKNEDETKKVEKCHICGRIVLRLEGYDCPKCGKFTCKDCYNTATGLCAECDNEKEEVYKQAVRKVLEDGRIDVDERKELMALQQKLGINLNRALELENQVKSGSSQKSLDPKTEELGNFDKNAFITAQTDLYDNLNYAEALKKLEPLYEKYKLNEEIMTDYFYALSKTDPDRALRTVNSLHADNLCIYLTQIDVAEAKKDYSQMEDCITKAEKFYKDSILLVSRKVSFYIRLSETTRDSIYLEIARESLESCPAPKTKLEKTWHLKTKMDMDAVLGQKNVKLFEEYITQDAFKGFFQTPDEVLKEMPLEKLMDLEKRSHGSRVQTQIGNILNNKKNYTEAVKWYRLAADQKNAIAQNSLGDMYYYGKGVAENYTEAVKWYKLAANQGYDCGQVNLGYCYEYGQGITKDYTEAIKWYRLSADQGNPKAQNSLGLCYEKGEGVTEDYAEAVKWYQLAANQGNTSAQNNLGEMYYYGKGVTKDYTEAVKWYRLAGEQGVPNSQIKLGNIYDKGEGVTKDRREAAKWWKLAAEQGCEEAQYLYGNVIYNGTLEDYVTAVKWYRLAAEKGYYLAQNALGWCYLEGKGVSKDTTEAVKWYRLAAEQGYLWTQTNLADLYNSGIKISRDYAEALKWYKRAAEQGSAYAQWKLGMKYDFGEGVPKDKIEAVKWYRLAAKQGHSGAIDRLKDMGVDK